jgi:hypothetical protein
LTLLEREAALDALNTATAHALTGHGRVALVYGEAASARPASPIG